MGLAILKTARAEKFPAVREQPRVAAAEAKLGEFRARLAKVDREFNEELAERSRQRDAIGEAAAALLADSSATIPSVVEGSTLDRLGHERRILRRAIDVQEQAVQAVRAEVMPELRARVRPEYVTAAKAVAAGLEAFSAGLEQYRRFRESVEDAEITGLFWLAALDNMRLRGEARGEWTVADYWLHEAKEQGLI